MMLIELQVAEDLIWGPGCGVSQSHMSYFFFFFFSGFYSGLVQLLISWSSTQVLVDRWGTFCAGVYPNVHFSFFLPGGCGGV